MSESYWTSQQHSYEYEHMEFKDGKLKAITFSRSNAYDSGVKLSKEETKELYLAMKEHYEPNKGEDHE